MTDKAHRHSKSVLTSCEKYGIPTVDAKGTARNNTELVLAIKAAKARTLEYYHV